MMELQRFKTKEETRERAALHLNKILDAHAHVPTLFLSSGGSSLELLDLVEIFPPNFTVGVTDERFSEDPKVNNFAQLAGTAFFQKAQEKGTYFIDTRVQAGEDLELFAKRFQEALESWGKEHPGGRIVITQGVGPDGHTVGIMPYPEDEQRFSELFEQEKRWAVGYDAGAKNPYPLRVTVTIPFLRQVDHAVTYLTGENKKKALQRILQEEGTLAATPARILREMKEATIFTDVAAS